MSLVLTAPSKFPAGTSVAAHIRSHWPTVPERPTGVPAGAAAETATVQTNRTLTFSALAAGTKYYLYAQVGGVDYVVAIDTGGTSTSNPEFKEGMTDGQVPIWSAANERFEGGTPAGTGIPATIVDAKGDIIAATAADTVARLAAGSNGQALTAQSGQASGLQWATLKTVATDVIFDAKGDLPVGTAADTAAKLAAGANGTFLSADSAQATGLKWVAPTGFGTSLPASPADNDRYFWEVDATNGVVWHMIWNAALSKWLFLGGPPLYNEVLAAEGTSGTTYAALTTAGPSITIPGAGGGLYMVGLGAYAQAAAAGAQAVMSYDIGATGAVDQDYVFFVSGGAGTSAASVARESRKSIATAVALTAKYKRTAGSGTVTFQNRWMTLLPVQVNPS
jgi:hypothetical protein